MDYPRIIQVSFLCAREAGFEFPAWVETRYAAKAASRAFMQKPRTAEAKIPAAGATTGLPIINEWLTPDLAIEAGTGIALASAEEHIKSNASDRCQTSSGLDPRSWLAGS